MQDRWSSRISGNQEDQEVEVHHGPYVTSLQGLCPLLTYFIAGEREVNGGGRRINWGVRENKSRVESFQRVADILVWFRMNDQEKSWTGRKSILILTRTAYGSTGFITPGFGRYSPYRLFSRRYHCNLVRFPLAGSILASSSSRSSHIRDVPEWVLTCPKREYY